MELPITKCGLKLCNGNNRNAPHPDTKRKVGLWQSLMNEGGKEKKGKKKRMRTHEKEE